MNEDQTRNRLDNGPENLAILRHMTLNILTAGTAKISKRRTLKRISEKFWSQFDVRLPCGWCLYAPSSERSNRRD